MKEMIVIAAKGFGVSERHIPGAGPASIRVSMTMKLMLSLVTTAPPYQECA
jgi:hypothetical protein